MKFLEMWNEIVCLQWLQTSEGLLNFTIHFSRYQIRKSIRVSYIPAGSLQASSLRHSRRRVGKGRRASNYISGIWISASKKSMWIQNVLIGEGDISNKVITSGTCLSMFVHIFVLISTLQWLVEIWQLCRWGATRKLEVQFKYQRRSCKLSFLFPPHHQSAPDSLLTGYLGIGYTFGLNL